MDINVEYPFIMFLSVFEITLIFLLSISNLQLTIEGIGQLPSSPTHWYDYFTYFFQLFTFFFKFLIVPTVPVSLKFLSVLVFTPLIIVFAWIILKTVGGFITGLIP